MLLLALIFLGGLKAELCISESFSYRKKRNIITT